MLADGIIFFSDLWSPKERIKNKGPFLEIGNLRLVGFPATSVRTEHERVRILVLQLDKLKTHNTVPPKRRLNDPFEECWSLTWPGREIDQKGSTPSVEQGHCTLIAVKRYRDPHGLVDGIIFYCSALVGHHC